MQVSVPENLKVFKTLHGKRGKSHVELWAKTGIVMNQQERTTTRVYGDSRGVGSSVTVDRAMWMQFEDGSEKCIEFPNTDYRIARPGHQITFISAINQLDKKNFSCIVALYNHTTDTYYFHNDYVHNFIHQWNHILYKKPFQLGCWFFLSIAVLTIVTWGIGLLFIPFIIFIRQNDRERIKQFKVHIEEIIEDFRKQLREK